MDRNFKYYTALLVFLSFVSTSIRAFGQSRENGPIATPTGVIPPAPDAAALGRYGDIPVSLYRGIPTITIPLTSLDIPGASLPISLDYNASGIKVDEVASSVGLGWALNAGGVITCAVNGKPDFIGTQSRVLPADIRTFNPSFDTNPTDYEFARRVIADASDTEPDIFYFNFAGKTGKFVISADRKQIVLLPYQPLAVRYTSTAAGEGFEITDERGVRYEFAESERSITTQDCNIFVPGRERVTSHGSSWYLTKITTPLGAQMTLHYASVKYSYKQAITETVYYQPTGPSGSGNCADLSNKNSKCVTTQSVYGKRLTQITSNVNDTRIEFGYSAHAREDIENSDTTGNNALESVRVKYGNKLIKEYQLTYSYFRSRGFTEAMPTTQKALYSRLRLDAVQRIGEPSHRFTYNTNVLLPERLSFAQDVWGYYNGASANQTLINRSTTYSLSLGADRAPNRNYVLANLLTQISYPTGGKTQFTFEANHSYAYQQYNDFAVGGFSVAPPLDRISLTDTLTVEAGSQAYDGVLSWYLPNDNGERTTGSIISPDGSKRFFASGSGSEKQTLTPGKYIITVIGRRQEGVYVGYSWKVPRTSSIFQNNIGRGIRIAQITDIPGSTGSRKIRRFRYPADTRETAIEGGIFGTPFAVSYPTDNLGSEYLVPNYDASMQQVSYCKYRIFTATSVPILGDEDEGVVFPAIAEYIDSAGVQGRITHTFTRSLSDFINQNSSDFYQNWAKGLPLKTIVEKFDKKLQKYVPVKQTDNFYFAHYKLDSFWKRDSTEKLNHEQHVPGYRIRYLHPEYVQTLGTSTEPTGFLVTRAEFIIDTYVYSSVWYYLKEKKETLYDPNDATRFTTTSTIFRYENPAHTQVTQQVQTGSNGTLLSTKFRYPLDYDTTQVTNEPARSLRLLARKHILTPVVERQLWKHPVGKKPILLGGEIIHYANLLKKSAWQTHLKAPADSTHFKTSFVQAGEFTQDETYQERDIVDRYDINGNILQQHKAKSAASSYIWGYSTSYPIAEIQNALYDQVAYTSFEPEETSKWMSSGGGSVATSGYTGGNSFQLNGSLLVVRDLPASTYLISCWVKEGTGTPTVNGQAMNLVGASNRGWRRLYIHLPLTSHSSVAVSGNGLIDELRLHPVQAVMTTATYDPLVGITSKMGPDYRVAHYEYDALGRLLRVRDEQGRILSENEYQYAQPQ